MPFDLMRYEATLNKKMTIGYYDDMSLLPSSDATKRAVRLVKEKLESLGHTLVHFPLSMEDTKDYSELWSFCLACSSQKQLLKWMKDNHEPL